MIKKEAKRGFTLVELLLVIAIIGILAAVLFVGLGKQRQRARMATFKESIRGLLPAATACRDARKNLIEPSEPFVADGSGVDICDDDEGVNLDTLGIEEIGRAHV